MPTVPPTKTDLLKGWSTNFRAKLSAAPTTVGCTALDATQYAALDTDFQARCVTSENPATKTKVTEEELAISKNALLLRARQLCRVINAYPGTTDAIRVSFGLNPRDVIPTPSPVPVTRPQLTVDAYGNVRMVDEATPTRRAKPKGTFGAVVFTVVLPAGTPGPTTPEEARYFGVRTTDRFGVPVTAADDGKILWALATWINTRGEHGPVSAPAFAKIAA